MAPADAAGLHAGVFHFEHVRAEQSHHPADGTDELLGVIAPALGLGEIKLVSQAAQQLRQQGLRRLAGDLFHHVDVIHAFDLLGHDLGRVHALAAAEAQQGFGGLARLVVGGLHRRAFGLGFQIGGLFRKVGDQQGQAAGGGQHFQIVIGQAGIAETFLGQLLQLFDHRRQKTGRYFFYA